MPQHKVAFSERQKSKDVRMSNIVSAKAVAAAVRTSLGPRGMDKMIQGSQGGVIITNDGATILRKMELNQPAAKMLQGLSRSQDIEAGDGTTSVVVIAGALLDAVDKLLNKAVHPTRISEAFKKCADKCEEILEDVAVPVDLDDRESLVACTKTSLSSKVVSVHSDVFSPLAVDAVLKVADRSKYFVDLNDIRIVKSVGGTIDETELVDGLVLSARLKGFSAKQVKNAKVGIIQFCLSPPKTDMDNSIVVSDYAAMDRLLREERKHIVGLIKKIKKSGCNVLLIQKSILRDAVNDLALHYLNKAKIVCITDVERKDVEFICSTLGCKPVAHEDHFKPEYLGHVGMVEQVEDVVKFSEPANAEELRKTASIVIKGSNRLILDECDRSIHDALCVVRSLIKKRYLIAGGGSAEAELTVKLGRWAQTLKGTDSYCAKAFAEALEIIPYTLAENAGMHPTMIVTELRKQHSEGKSSAGVDVKSRCISDMKELNILQPLLVNLSAISLATETIIMILKIDDIVPVM